MPKKYVAWDIEISKTLPDGEMDWWKHVPLGISCMATVATNEAPTLWFSKDHDGNYSSSMTPSDLVAFVSYLDTKMQSGYEILTFNGLGFDWRVLSIESGVDCSQLALNHIDMMFHFFCLKGFPLGLNTAAVGMGLPGKTEGVNGALAPQMWQDGRYQEVLNYVSQDVRTTLDVAQAVDKLGCLNWTAKSGRANGVKIPRWLTCAEALRLPEPDTSWMTNPKNDPPTVYRLAEYPLDVRTIPDAENHRMDSGTTVERSRVLGGKMNYYPSQETREALLNTAKSHGASFIHIVPVLVCDHCGNDKKEASSYGYTDPHGNFWQHLCNECYEAVSADWTDDEDRCAICDSLMEWEDCYNCADGYIDLYDEDPLWYDEDDVEECETCRGRGGWWYCPNARNHKKVMYETKTSSVNNERR